MQMNAQNRSRRAQSAATMAELARQKTLRQEAERVFASSLKKGTQSDQAVDTSAKEQQRNATYQSILTRPEDTGYAPSVGGSAPEVIQGEYSKAGESAQRYGAQQGKARAALDAFGDNQTFLNIFNRRQGGKLANTGNFSAGSQQVLPLELEAARRLAASPLGDLFVGIGQAAGAFAGVPGAGATGAPTNIVPSALGPPARFTPGVPFTPSYFSSPPQFQGL
jgi:hypothetical protein